MLFLPANGAAIGAFQEPCSLDPNDPCLRITASEPLNRFVRSFSFAAPRAGTALVSFHGSMSCDIFEASASRVVDIVTQIGTDPNVAPSINDPGGLRHAIRLLPNEDLNYDSFSLASTRAFVVPNAGTNTYYFKLATLRRDANTQCRFYNLSFSLLFT